MRTAQGPERVYGSGIDFAVVRLASHKGTMAGRLATGATLTLISSTSTSKTARFTYAGTGVDVRCSFTD